MNGSFRKKVRILRSGIPLWLLALLLVAAGVGAAVGTILVGKLIGEVPVTVSQALLVGTPNFPDSLPSGVNLQAIRVRPHAPDRSVGIVGDDRTSFRAAAEVDTGDVFLIMLPLKNASDQDLVAELTVTVPDGIEVEVIGSDEESGSAADHTRHVTHSGWNTWNFCVSRLADMYTGDWRDSIGIVVGADDNLKPGFYTIEAVLEQIGGTCAVPTVLPSLSLSKTGAAEVNLDEQITYTITARNDSDIAATQVTVTDTIPVGMTYISSSPTATVYGNLATWSLGTLGSGSSKTMLLTLRANQTGYWTNAVTATCAENVTATASASTTVLTAGVDIEKSGPPSIVQGANAIYNIIVTNTGNANLINVLVTDTVPTGMSYVSSNPGATVIGTQVSWALGSVYPGQPRTLSLTLKGVTAGSWTDSVSVACDQGVTDTDSATTTVEALAGGMTWNVEDTPDPIFVGETTTYKVTVRNQGTLTLHNVRIANTISEKTSFVSASGPVTYSVVGRTVAFSPVATIAPNEVLTYYITVLANTPGIAVNITTMTYDEFALPLTHQEPTGISAVP